MHSNKFPCFLFTLSITDWVLLKLAIQRHQRSQTKKNKNSFLYSQGPEKWAARQKTLIRQKLVYFTEKAMAPHWNGLENPMDGEAWWAAVHGVAKLSDFTFTLHFHALKKEMATHSSVLAWRIPGTGEPRGLPYMGVTQSQTWLKWLSSSSSSSSTSNTKEENWPQFTLVSKGRVEFKLPLLPSCTEVQPSPWCHWRPCGLLGLVPLPNYNESSPPTTKVVSKKTKTFIPARWQWNLPLKCWWRPHKESQDSPPCVNQHDVSGSQMGSLNTHSIQQSLGDPPPLGCQQRLSQKTGPFTSTCYSKWARSPSSTGPVSEETC